MNHADPDGAMRGLGRQISPMPAFYVLSTPPLLSVSLEQVTQGSRYY